MLGSTPGERGRDALILQVSQTGRTRAFQLHDPSAEQTVWVNERDLLGRVELPFGAKFWRRITAISLPETSGARAPGTQCPPAMPLATMGA